MLIDSLSYFGESVQAFIAEKRVTKSDLIIICFTEVNMWLAKLLSEVSVYAKADFNTVSCLILAVFFHLLPPLLKDIVPHKGSVF